MSFYVDNNTSNKGYVTLLIKKLTEIINQHFNKKIVYEEDDNKNISLPNIALLNYEVILNGKKSINIDVNIITNNADSRDEITLDTFNIINSLIPCNEIISIDVKEPLILDFGEKEGVFRKLIQVEFLVKYSPSMEEKKEIDLEKDRIKLAKICESITGFFATSFAFSPSKKYMLCYSNDEAYLIEDEKKEVWYKKLCSINEVAISQKEDIIIFATFLTKEEMGDDFKIGGHAYCFDIQGNLISDNLTKAVAESCAIAPSGDFYVVGTVKPENSVYCYNLKGDLLWLTKVGKVVLHLDIEENGDIIVYTGTRKDDKEKLCVLNNEGEIIK